MASHVVGNFFTIFRWIFREKKTAQPAKGPLLDVGLREKLVDWLNLFQPLENVSYECSGSAHMQNLSNFFFEMFTKNFSVR